MRFKDIPQFTRVGSYQINTELDYYVEWINESVNEKELSPLNLEPDFQRGHVWSETQQIKFIEYFLKGGVLSPIYFNHPNWLGNFMGDFVLCDGLQRTKAFQRFVNNEIKVFGYYYKQFEGKCYHSTIIVNVNNLKTRKEVLQWYLDLNSGGVVHTKEELDKVRKLLEMEK